MSIETTETPDPDACRGGPSGPASGWRSRPGGEVDPLERARSFARVAANLGIVTRAPRVGPYPIIRKLGVGGMGIVYAALDRDLGREIAVKVLRHPDEPEQRDRLEREARTLARLSHPNVVTVHGVGTDRDRTYIAMALVDGANLSAWSRADERSLEQVLDVFAQAGRGLAAAHHAGVVHRDFKPANVLVDRAGRARVADFGIAREGSTGGATGASDAGEDPTDDEATREGGVFGTPAFMAPEQYRSGDVGPAADQYAFCLSLVDVLDGRLPFEVSGAHALGEAKYEGRLRTPDPTRVPPRLWAVLQRGLSPAPSARYPDLPALLSAIEASTRPPRWRALWFTTTGVVVAVALAIVVAGAFSTPPVSRPEADPCADFGDRVAELWGPEVQAQMSDAYEATGLDMSAEMFARASEVIGARFEGWVERQRDTCRREQLGLLDDRQLDARQRCLDARLEETRAMVQRLGDADRSVVQRTVELTRAEPLASCDIPWTAYWLQRQHPVGEAMPRARALADRTLAASALVTDGRPDEARAAYDELIEELEARDEPSARAELFRLRSQLEPDPAQKEALLWRAMDAAVATHDVRATVVTSTELAALAQGTGRLELSREWIELGLAENARLRTTFADDPSAVFWAAAFEAELLNLRGLYEQAVGRTDDALQSYQASVRALEPVTDAFPILLANGLNNIAEIHRLLGSYDAAAPFYDRAVFEAEARLGHHHPTLAAVLGNRAALRIDMGRPERALADLVRAVDILENVEGPESAGLVVPVINLGLVHQARGELEEAETELRRGMALSAKNLGEAHPFTAYARGMVGAVVRDAGRPAEALPLIETAVQVMNQVFPHGHALSAAMLTERAETRRALGKLEGAEADARSAISTLEGTGGAGTPAFAVARMVLGDVLASRGDEEAALVELDAAIEQLTQIGPPERPELQHALEVRSRVKGEERP